MTKSELTKQIERITESPLINLSQIAKLAKIRRETAAEMMRGCRVDRRGKGKYFFVADVAEKLMERTEIY